MINNHLVVSIFKILDAESSVPAGNGWSREGIQKGVWKNNGKQRCNEGVVSFPSPSL